MPGWMNHKLESTKTAGRNSNNLKYADNGTLMEKKWRGTKEFVEEGETGEWKSWLETQHSKNEDHGIWFRYFMANRWGNNGNSGRFYFLGLPNHCGEQLMPWNEKMLGRIAMTNLDSILKSRHITLLTKVHRVKAMVFPVVMYRCETWTINKAERWRTDAFKLKLWY